MWFVCFVDLLFSWIMDHDGSKDIVEAIQGIGEVRCTDDFIDQVSCS